MARALEMGVGSWGASPVRCSLGGKARSALSPFVLETVVFTRVVLDRGFVGTYISQLTLIPFGINNTKDISNMFLMKHYKCQEIEKPLQNLNDFTYKKNCSTTREIPC